MDPEQIPLRDLHLPAEIGWWPLAPGWWFLLALIAAGCCWVGWRAVRRWQANRARRIALAQLTWIKRGYEDKQDAVGLARELSELLRRALLAYAPRNVVAGLTGDEWLRWLDRGLPEPVFSAGAGRQLGTLPYQDPTREGADDDVQALIEAVRIRLKTPLPEAGR